KQHQLNIFFVRTTEGEEETMRAQQIRVTSPDFETAGGIRTGSPIDSIRRDFTPLHRTAFYTRENQETAYLFEAPADGISFEIVYPDSICVAMTVHEKRLSPKNSYLPVHPTLRYYDGQ